jgi:NADH dehydrogenase
VVSMGRLQFAGFPGWIVWLFIHIGFLTGYRNRFGAVLSWWFAFTRDLRRERTFTTKQVGIVSDVYGSVPASAPAPDTGPRPQ